MKISVEFDNEDEYEAFKVSGKKTRAKKADGTEDTGGAITGGPTGGSPQPLMPAQGFSPGAGFAPQGQPAGQPGGAFPAAGAMGGPAPDVLALVQRVNKRIDWCMQPPPNGGGQQAADILTWFRQQLGPDVANYTLDQIRQVALPRAPAPVLENMAKLMGG